MVSRGPYLGDRQEVRIDLDVGLNFPRIRCRRPRRARDVPVRAPTRVALTHTTETIQEPAHTVGSCVLPNRGRQG